MNALTVMNATTMTSLEISSLVESRHDNVRTAIEKLAEKNVIELPVLQVKATGGRPSDVYVFSGEKGRRDSIIVVAQLCPEFTARIVDRWQELESKQTNHALPTTYIEALEHLLDAKKQEQLAIAARDLAIATKAQIGAKREATAMATASAAIKKAKALEIELDKSKQYATIKRVEAITEKQYNWRTLKAASMEVGQPPIDVFDANYGTLKAYHADVWKAAYDIVLGEF